MIPVIDVFFQHQNVGLRNWLFVLQARQQMIGRRTTGAAFGGEQLDHHWSARVLGARERADADSQPSDARPRGDHRLSAESARELPAAAAALPPAAWPPDR